VEVFSEKIDGLFLLAPDGLKVNPFYFIGTRNRIGRWIFEGIIDHPGPLFGLGNFLEKMKLINPRLNHFVKHEMNSAEKRRQVYHVWVLFRKFIPDLKSIASNINNHNIYLLMFFGKYDTVIKAKLGNKLLRHLNDKKNVMHVLDCGHRVMERNEEINRWIMKR
jgi:pimeloyl-ACP methyl ester carboxylesterase